MQFTTKVPISKTDFPIDYDSEILSLGSCFAENMSEKFEYFKLRQALNPFGIIFNPVSIENLIKRALKRDYFTEKDIFFYNDRWNCYEVHSELSHSNKEEFLKNLNRMTEQLSNQISQATHIVLTLGTAWVYRFIESGQIVANCHKVPQKRFTKELLSIEQIKESLENILKNIQEVNPQVKLILTVSPVRHIKDGFVENQRSKAHLISAVHDFIASNSHLPHLPVSYFPSYEIMMDELRDYRFYGQDMLHPGEVAIDYIWQRFKETSISELVYKTMDEVSIIQKGLAHRSFNPNSESHMKFIANLQYKIRRLQEQFPFIKFHV